MHSSSPKTKHSNKLANILFWLAVPLVLVGLTLAIFIAINNRPPTVSIPTPKLPNPNGYDDFVSATTLKSFTKGPLSDRSRPIDSWTIPQLEAFVQDNAQAMAAVRSGLQKEYLAPLVSKYASENDYTRFLQLARIIAGESLYYRKIGKYAIAADSSLDVMEFGVTLLHGGNFNAMLLSCKSETTGADDLPVVIPKLDRMELAHVAKRLEIIQSKRVSFSDVVIQDGDSFAAALSTWMVQNRWKPKTNLQDLVGTFTLPPYELPNPYFQFSDPPDRRQQAQYVLTNKSTLIREVQSYYQRLSKAQKRPYNGQLGTSPYKGPFNGAIQDPSWFMYCRSVYCRAEAITTMLQTEVALRRYKADHGSYPASLRALAPKYLKKTPIDPFGQGKPFCYKQQNNGQGFLLYSRGTNLKDDGGKDAPWDKKDGKDLVAAN